MESWALVTGAGSGIGRGIVLALAQRQQRIILVGRRRQLLEGTAAEAQALGATCYVIDCDLAAVGAVEELVNKVHQHCGSVKILIHNAGVLAPGPIASYSSNDLDRAMAVNFLAPIQLTRALLPNLVSHSGSVVLVASTAAWLPFPFMSMYSATKGGLRMWGESFRTELEAQGARLLIAYPPFTRTSMVRGMSDGAGLRFPLASPEVVGEQIVRALHAERRELWCAWSDRCLAWMERAAPWLVHAILRNQRHRFRQIAEAAEARL